MDPRLRCGLDRNNAADGAGKPVAPIFLAIVIIGADDACMRRFWPSITAENEFFVHFGESFILMCKGRTRKNFD